MSVCKKKGWYIASIGGLSACDHDRFAAMKLVAEMFNLTWRLPDAKP